MTTQITVVGNLVRDPELRFTPSGAAVCNFTVVDNERIKDQNTGEWKDGDATFYECSVWRDAAENVAESLQSGNRVVVQGTVKLRSYERPDGSKGASLDLRVDEVGPSLRWATAKVTRTSKQNGGQNNGGQQGGYQNGSQNNGSQQGQPQYAGAGAPAAGGGNPWGDPAPGGGWGGDATPSEPPF